MSFEPDDKVARPRSEEKMHRMGEKRNSTNWVCDVHLGVQFMISCANMCSKRVCSLSDCSAEMGLVTKYMFQFTQL